MRGDAHKRVRAIACLVVAAALLFGCGGTLRVENVASAHKKPDNVWLLFTVERDGDPVRGLSAEDFSIFEDGQLVSQPQSKQVLQDVEKVSARRTLVLVDMSGGIGASPRADALVDALTAFVERVGKTQHVGVYAFDGSDKLHAVVPLDDEAPRMERGLEALRSFKPEDTSTNLHGAVVQALRELKASLNRDGRPIQFGTLVVVSSGRDRAARVSADEMRNELESEAYRRYEFYAIGLGSAVDGARLRDIGRDGTEIVMAGASGSTRLTLDAAIAHVAARIESRRGRAYLLSYCTPARRGDHTVHVEVHTRDKTPASGSLRTTFNADGFGTPPECDPTAPPAFDSKPPRDPEESQPKLPVAKKSEEARGHGHAAGREGAHGAAKAKPAVIDWRPTDANGS